MSSKHEKRKKRRKKKSKTINPENEFAILKRQFDLVFEDLKNEDEFSFIDSSNFQTEKILEDSIEKKFEKENTENQNESKRRNVQIINNEPQEILEFNKLHTVNEMKERISEQKERKLEELNQMKQEILRIVKDNEERESFLKDMIRREKYLDEEILNLRDDNKFAKRELKEIEIDNTKLEEDLDRIIEEEKKKF